MDTGYNPWLSILPTSESSLKTKTSSQGLEVKKATGYIVLPAFSFAVEATVHSRIVAQFLYQASRTFSLELTYPQNNPYNFTLAVRWRAMRECWRRKLYEDDYFLGNVYNQERIHRFFVLEVWSKTVTTVTNPTDLVLKTSVKSVSITPVQYFLECALSNYAALNTLNFGSFPISLPILPNALGPWLSNYGQYGEIGASSSQTAANKMPAGFP